MSTIVKYKNQVLSEFNQGTVTLDTKNKLMDDFVEVVNDGGGE